MEIVEFDPVNGTHIPNRDELSQSKLKKLISLGDINFCPVCGKRTASSLSGPNFLKFCSSECKMIDRHNHKEEIAAKRKATNLARLGCEFPTQSKLIQEKTKKTNLKRYGVEVPSQSKEVQEKIKRTNLERYGVERPTMLPELKARIRRASRDNADIVQEKLKKTNLERYGVEYNWQREDVKQKIKETNIERYGVECGLQSTEIREKGYRTNLERYGVEHPAQSEEIRIKAEQTNLERYGVKNPFQSEDIKEKIKETNLEKYGVEHPTQSREIKEKIQRTNLERYGTECPFQSDIIKEKIKTTNLEKYGFEYASQSEEIKERMKKTCIEKYGAYPANAYKQEEIDEFIRLAMENVDCYTISSITGRDAGGIRQCLLENGIVPFKYLTAPESSIKRLLDENYSGRIILNDRTAIKPLEIDIWLPEKNIGIEVNGEYWHNEEAHHFPKFHIRDKWRVAQNAGIQIIELNANEINERFNQISNLLLSKLVANKSVYARKCRVVELNVPGTVTSFINGNHIQPISVLRSNEKCYGLVHDEKIISICLFSPHHRNINQKDVIVLKRFCCEKGIRVIGGASKLLKHAIKENGWKHIISWSDNRFSTGNLYEKIGFTLEKELPASYSYWDSHTGKTRSKQSCKKENIGCKEGQTEYERAKELGLYRMWDCGKKRWSMIL